MVEDLLSVVKRLSIATCEYALLASVCHRAITRTMSKSRGPVIPSYMGCVLARDGFNQSTPDDDSLASAIGYCVTGVRRPWQDSSGDESVELGSR